MLTRLFIIILLIFGLFNHLFSQNYYHNLFTVQDGLAQSQIFAMHQDHNNLLWIGTVGGGINVYDGKSFENINQNNGLSGNRIFSITQDSKNRYWIGTNNGVTIIDGKNYSYINQDDGLPNNQVWDISIDKEGKAWIATNKGVAIYENNKLITFDKNQVLTESPVFKIFIDNKNRVWFGTSGKGLFVLEKNSVTNFTTEDNLNHMNVRTINEDNYGNIWIGTDLGPNVYSKSKLIKSNDRDTYVSSAKTKDGKILLLSYLSNIKQVALKNDSVVFEEVYAFLDYRSRSLLLDNEGSMWIGSESGLIQMPFNYIKNFNTNFGLNNNNIYAFCEVGKNMYWIGASNMGATLFREQLAKENRFYNISPVTHNLVGSNVFSIIKDKKDRIWFGTGNGITILDPKDSSYTHIRNEQLSERMGFLATIIPELPSNYFLKLFEDFRGNIWAGTNNGVCIFTDTSIIDLNKQFPELEKNQIRDIYQDKLGQYWFAAQNGVYCYNNKTLKHYGKNEGFIEDRVNTITQDRFGYYWFSTREGIYVYNGYEFKQITTDDGLLSNNIYSLIYDGQSYLYAGTERGLDRIDVREYKDLNKINIKNYTYSSGFLGIECNLNAMLIDQQNRLFVGTVLGFNIIDFSKERINTVVPKVRITNIQLDFQDVNWADFTNKIDSTTGLPKHLVLPHNRNHLTFFFASNSLTVPEKNRYRYWLEGIDSDWSPPFSKNEADYPILPSGKYTFHVISSNNDGLWSDTPTSFTFEILPPFYLTWWFITIVILSIVLIIIVYIKYREKALKQEKLILEEKVKERTVEIERQKEIVEEKNKDITDSINYAKNIQEALLPDNREISNSFPDSFILFKPRDIVSGDYYWISEKDNKTFFAVADCTGHGVPGAFMSLLGIAFLDEIIVSHTNMNASELLNLLRNNVMESLKQTGKEGESKDGMDMSLIIFDKATRTIEFCGANNPLYFIRNNVLTEYKSQKMPIGYHPVPRPFEHITIELFPGDIIYMFSDGYADQFGGPSGKKFKYKAFKELLERIAYQPMSLQKEMLNNEWIEWKGELEQVDDVIVAGIRFSNETLSQQQ